MGHPVYFSFSTSTHKHNSPAMAKYSTLRTKENKKYKKPTRTSKKAIHKVLKQVHPDQGISSKGMNIANDIVEDLWCKLWTEAKGVAKMNNHKKIGVRDIQTAVRLLLPGELSKHAVSEGEKAVQKLMQ